MDLKDLVRTARRRWLTIAAFVVLALLAAGVISAKATPEYSSQARVFISNDITSSQDAYAASLYSAQRVKSYADLANSRGMMLKVIADLDLKITPEALAGKVSASVVPDTVIILVNVTDVSPEGARQIAQSEADNLARYLTELETPQGKGTSAIKASVIDPADLNTAAVSPRTGLNLVVAGILGLIVGLGVALLRELFDNSVSDEHDVRDVTPAPTMARIGYDRRVSANPVIGSHENDAARSEAFRILRTNLQFLDIDTPVKSLVISSAVADEGKSLTTAELAVVVAQTGQRVLVVDADLRRPRMAPLFGLSSDVGTDQCAGRQDRRRGVHPAALPDRCPRARQRSAATEPFGDPPDEGCPAAPREADRDVRPRAHRRPAAAAGGRRRDPDPERDRRDPRRPLGEDHEGPAAPGRTAPRGCRGPAARRHPQHDLPALRRLRLRRLRGVMSARILPAASGAALLLALVVAACQGPLFAAAALAVAVLATALVTVGIERLGVGFLVLALLTAPMNSVRPSSSASFVTMSDLLFIVGAGLLAPRLMRGRLWLPTKYVVGAFLLLVVGAISSIVAAQHPDLSLNLLGRLVAASMVMPVIFMLWAPSARVIDVLAAAYVVGQSVSVFYAVVDGPTDNGRYDGLTVHPNFFAMCAITAIALLLHLLHRVPRSWRWLVLAAAAVNAYGVVLSGSRMGFGLLVVLAIAYPVIERSALSMYAVAALGVTSLLVANAVLVHAGSGSALNRLQGDSTASTSDSIRGDQLHAAFAAIRHSPVIGNGFENALDAQNIYSRSPCLPASSD